MVLRQWHTSYNSRHIYIYNNSGVTITNIYFGMSKSSQIVTAINFSPNIAKTSDSECYVFSIKEVRIQINLNIKYLLT